MRVVRNYIAEVLFEAVFAEDAREVARYGPEMAGLRKAARRAEVVREMDLMLYGNHVVVGGVRVSPWVGVARVLPSDIVPLDPPATS